MYSLGQDGGDSLAGTAPGGKAVEHDNLVVLESLLPGVNAIKEILLATCSAALFRGMTV